MATSMLIAHEVIPHHHHDGAIHFDSHDCGHEPCNATAEKEGQTPDETECCALSDVVIILPDFQDREMGCSCNKINWGDHSHNFFATITTHYGGWLLYAKFLSVICPRKDMYYPGYKGSLPGLRAPPLV